MMQKHKLLAFLLALVISIGLWVYAVTVVNPDGTVDIRGVRVRLVGLIDLQSNNLMITDGEEQYVNVSVRGRRSDLKELNSSNLEATADLSNITAAGEYELTWTLNPPQTVASGDIKLVEATPAKITVSISEYRERPSVPVSVEYGGTLAEGYLRGAETVGELSLAGPAEEVSKVARAVVRVDLTDRSESIDADYPYVLVDEAGTELTLSDNVTVSKETVHLELPVMRYKEVELKVKLIDGGGVTAKETECTVEPKSIIVTGSDEALDELDSLEVMTIDLAEITEAQTWDITPELPAGVTNLASDTTARVDLKFVGVVTTNLTFLCTDIVRVNDDESLEFAEKSVVITVRGKAMELSGLSAADLRVTADMSGGYDPSTKTVTLTVSLPDGANAAVIGGPYTVQVVSAS